MAKFKVQFETKMSYEYEIEAETAEEAEREAESQAQDGFESRWWDLDDVEILSTEEIEE